MSPTMPPGAPFPDLRLPTIEGEELAIHDFRGVRLLAFTWASW